MFASEIPIFEPTTGLPFSAFEFDMEYRFPPVELRNLAPSHLLPDERLGWCIGYACSVLKRQAFPNSENICVTIPEFVTIESSDLHVGFFQGIQDHAERERLKFQ